MVKVRMNTADVAAEVKCLRRLIGMRCANVYDISPKAYLFKLMNSSGITESGESEKVLLLMESGIRLHTTQYVRDKNMTPSGFTLKIRKHIRTRRLEDVRQLGYDRIILFQFGLGSNAYFIILELYAQGNIILTDSEFIVMTLLRSHRDDDKGLAIMSRHRYPIEACRVFERTNLEKLRSRLACWFEPTSGSQVLNDVKGTISVDEPKELTGGKNMEAPLIKGNNGNRSNKTTIKAILGEVLSYGPALAEHVVMDAGLPPNMKVGIDSDGKLDEVTIELLAQATVRFEDWLQDVMSGMLVPEGYIFMQSKPNGRRESSIFPQESTSDKMYDEFCPLFLNQFRSREYMQFETFDGALDEFYSKIESQRAEQQQKTKEGTAIQKLDKIRLDQENRVGVLKKEVDHSVKMAELIEYNLEDVDAAILAVRVALANGMDWKDLTRMVKEERKSGNPIANLIHQLHLERNCITLLLSNNLDEMDDDEKTSPVEKVEVDLALSAHANARRWYELKKKQESKQEKTIAAHKKAFKAAEKKTYFQLSQEKTVAAISHMRKVHWFEKFNWFISSENYLVISGRDAQQNEMIVKRYMSKGDLYVHADLHGASSTVIKNHKPDHAIPPLTLNQAGCFTVCQSQAWDSKIVTSAWWVYPHQVSKTAPTGEYLTVGSFMIRGKKNFLPPHPLVMGFGILFRLDESSLASHVNERRVRGEDELSNKIGMELHNEQSYSDSNEEIASGGHTPKEADFPTALSTSNHKIDDSSTGITTESMVSSSHIATTSEEPKEGGVCRQTNLHSGEPVDANENFEPSASSQLEVLIDKALGLGPVKASSRSFDHDALVQQLEAQDSEDIGAMRREKPYTSKAERRKLKKGPKNTEMSNGIEDKEGNKQDSLGSEINGSNKNMKKDNVKLVRGQKGKLKKIKEKYSEQDDEERRIRMALLASIGKAHENEMEEPQAAVGIVHKSTQSPLGENESSKICYKCKKIGHLSRDCQQHTSEVKSKDIQNKNDGDAHEEALGVEPAFNLDKIAKEEDDINEIAGEREKLNDLDMLTGVPLSNDILLYAVPVCGPYSAIQTYKYHVKITPGSARKGKAAKTAIALFSHIPEVTAREKELMKACTEPELVAAMIGNAKITAPGLSQLKQKEKRGKKSNNKEH